MICYKHIVKISTRKGKKILTFDLTNKAINVKNGKLSSKQNESIAALALIYW